MTGDLVSYFLLMCLGLGALGLAVFVVTLAFSAARFVGRWLTAARARRRYGDGRWWKAYVR